MKRKQFLGILVLLVLLLLHIEQPILCAQKAYADDNTSGSESDNGQKNLSPEALREQLNKLRLLEQKNLSRMKQYENNPTASIKLKSNLVIIRLKMKSISKQLGIEPKEQDNPGK